MGICGANTPEVYTNLLFEEVATWVRDVSEPWRETSVCNQDGEDTPSAVSMLKSYLKLLIKIDSNIEYILMLILSPKSPPKSEHLLRDFYIFGFRF